MKRRKLTVVHTHADLELFHTIYPLLIYMYDSKDIEFVHINTNKFRRSFGENVMFIRIFKGRFHESKFIDHTIDKLRQNFNKLYFLDDSAGADSLHFEFIDRIDGYYKTKLLLDQNYYNKDIYGRQIFSEYYHHLFGVNDEIPDIRKACYDNSQFEKLSLAHNLGYGVYTDSITKKYLKKIGRALAKFNRVHLLIPYYKYTRKALIEKLSSAIDYKKKQMFVSARYRYKSYPKSIGYQRYLFDKIISRDKRFKTGLISQKEFDLELKNAFSTLSPFGYGEVCLRDFETIINGSLLLKPDMSHLRTKPDIYKAWETYVPLKWDGSDLLDIADNILSNPTEYYTIIDQSRAAYRDSLINMENEINVTYGNLFS